jgi:non-specific serine/threonine protein kinase
VVWLDRLEVEADNLRAALAWTVERHAESAARLATASAGYWLRRGHLSEGHGWLNRLLEQRDALPPPARLDLLTSASVLAGFQGDATQERVLIEEVYELATNVDNEAMVALACNNLGTLAIDACDYIQAEEWFARAAAIHQRTENKRGLAAVTLNLGVVAALKGDPNTALQRYGEAKVLSHQAGDRRGEAEALDCIGQTAIDLLGDTTLAVPALAGALEIFRVLRDPVGIAYCLQGLAKAAALTGEPVLAAKWDGAAQILRDTTGAMMAPFMIPHHQRAMDAAREQLGEEAFLATWETGRGLPIDDVMTEALVFTHGFASDGATGRQ